MGFWAGQACIWAVLSVIDLVLRLAVYQNPWIAVSLTLMLFPAGLGISWGMRQVYRHYRPEDQPAAKALGLVLLTSVVAATVLVALAASLRLGLGWSVPGWGLLHIWMLFGTFHFAVVLGWGLGYVWLATANARALEQANLQQAQALAVRHELDKLRMQLEPHFLFNALNGVGTEILEHPQQALAMVQDLSDFTRHALRTLERPVVTLAEELAGLQAYLNVQRARFADELVITQAIDPQALPRAIASFVLQPLVENAFEHGVREPDQQLRLVVRAVGPDLQVEVWNRGVLGQQQAQGHYGVGLRNLQRRLGWHYPNRFTLHLRAASPVGQEGTPWVCVSLELKGVPCSGS